MYIRMYVYVCRFILLGKLSVSQPACPLTLATAAIIYVTPSLRRTASDGCRAHVRCSINNAHTHTHTQKNHDVDNTPCITAPAAVTASGQDPREYARPRHAQIDQRRVHLLQLPTEKKEGEGGKEKERRKKSNKFPAAMPLACSYKALLCRWKRG